MARALRSFLLPFCVLIARAPALCAQAIGGTVIDELTRRPRLGLVVDAYDSVTTVSDKTREDGTFMLALPHAGTFSLRINRDGAEPLIVPAVMVARDSLIQRVFPIPAGRAYWEFEVDEKVQPRPGSTPLHYPLSLRQRNVEGDVLAQYVVEATGHVREGSLKILRSSDGLFTEAVRLFLPTAEFTPAKIRGVAVAQLVQQPFTFRLH
jgi:TonB family protein